MCGAVCLQGGLIGPFRFEGTVTGINYLTMLADSIFPAIRALYGNDDFYFQLDGAPPHYHRDVRAYLDQNLSGQWIGRRGPIEFPARSPDLTPLDFFLWGTVKDGVYKRKPRNLDILWNEIQAVCREISLDVLIRCTESVVTRTQNCIDAADIRCEENKLKITELIKSNRRISIKDLSSETGLSVRLCHQIVTKDLDMIRTSSKFVPRILTEEQKGYDPETKRQSSQWIERGEPKPKKARFTKSKVKTLLVTFFDINGLGHHEFIPFGRAINQEVYLGIMRSLREAVRLKRSERWQNNDWILHVDNARPHTSPCCFAVLGQAFNHTDPSSTLFSRLSPQ
ncbi:hypothetical protein LAZ67_16002235 [Cordylochernes scorpioides]|uniref:Transposase n=1 Tax=Cordylochernes scorpioides TaxID=51811 RepID=A0ABY6LG11_9ARAC|nr:hypothetical protein LAZ67_16002235 [Cordylochernes scorpioides]